MLIFYYKNFYQIDDLVQEPEKRMNNRKYRSSLLKFP